jgi:hypothetical protein
MDTPNKPFDHGSKRLLSICAQDLLDLLAPGSYFTGQFSEQFQSAELMADTMIETIRNNEREFVNIEFQSGPDPDMAQRLLEYAILAHRRYQCPIRSYVIYLRKIRKSPRPPLIRKYIDGEKFLWFRYKVIHISKMPHREVLEQDCKGLFPLVPLMKGGGRRAVVEEIIERLQPSDDTIHRELLALTGLFASLAFSRPEDLAWSKRRFEMLNNIFKDTVMHQYYMDMTRKEVEQQICENLRHTLLVIVQAHFPTLVNIAKTQVAQINNVTTINTVIDQVGSAQTLEEAQNALLNWQQIDSVDQ